MTAFMKTEERRRRKGTNDESGFGNVECRMPVEHVSGDVH